MRGVLESGDAGLAEDEAETLRTAILATCDECLDRVSEFAERKLAGRPLPEALLAVDHHLAICRECREEYEALRRALRSLGPGGHSA